MDDFPENLHEAYDRDPLEADRRVWGRESDPGTRRGFLRNAGLAAMSWVLGGRIVHADEMPAGLIPAPLADPALLGAFPGKHPDLKVLNDKPLNLETPAHLLDDAVTPVDRFFVRNNGLMPPEGQLNAATWKLTIDGEAVPRPITLTLPELKSRFQHHTYDILIECGGNGRADFSPPTKGNQWSNGGVGCARWTGVRLRDVLKHAGVTSKAVYIGYYGKDVHLNQNPDKVVISRGVPIAKAMEDTTLLAWAMNGKDIPIYHGRPLRLVVGGWPASVSGKWVHRIAVRDRVHDGPKMESPSYRVPKYPVAPGTVVPDEDMVIIGSMPVKSLITYPRSGAMITLGQALPLRGHAWAGDDSVKAVDVSSDFGATWTPCALEPARNRFAWQRWSVTLRLPTRGYYEVWVRATDDKGRMQPMVSPAWNPQGYLNNATHRIAVKVT